MPNFTRCFPLLADSVKDAVLLLDREGGVLSANRAAEELLGIDRRAPASRRLGEFVDAEPDRMAAILKQWARSNKSTASRLRLRAASGTVSDFQCEGHAILPLPGAERLIFVSCRRTELAGVRFVALGAQVARLEREVRSRRAAEARAVQLNEQLEVRVAERTAELRAANLELEHTVAHLQAAQSELTVQETMASLGRLVAGIAHEVNTPIGVGLLSASHLRDRVLAFQKTYRSGRVHRKDIESFMGSADEASAILLTNIKRASDLIRSFKQVAVDQSSGSWRRYSLHEYIEETLLSLKPQLRGSGHKLEVSVDEGVEIFGNPGVLYQVVSNLVMNSVVHAFDGDRQGTIGVRGWQSDDRVSVEVCDDGGGIREEHLERLFEPFFTTKRGRGGTGLGLHLVHNLVSQQLGGEIRCHSEVGRGTTFEISFPSRIDSREPMRSSLDA